MPFFIIFLIIPLAELYVFANVSTYIGIVETLALAFLTAVIGGWVVRTQGLETLHAIRSNLNKGALPTSALFDGFCLIVAGATLITPGFITDTLGFLLLIPAFRSILKQALKKHIDIQAHQKRNAQHRYTSSQTIIEGEYETMQDNGKKTPDNDNRND